MTLPSQGEPNWENRTLFHGDNLEFLRAMNSKSVHLIATDPPFNKGRDFHATPDSLSDGASFHDRWSWDKDVHEEWVDQITDDWPLMMNVVQGSRNSYGDDMGAFLGYMAVRLTAMRRVLRDDGSIYLHCDPTASHYMTHAKMWAYLLAQQGCKCQGCGRSFDDDRYLELDHIVPRADGGVNHVSNRILLCGPCNRAKSHRLTLSGLQELNRKSGWMAEGTK